MKANNPTLQAALLYRQAGISYTPVKRDGTKSPCGAWKHLQERLPTDEEIAEWFDRPDPHGIATIGGEISGNLELIDFDLFADVIFPEWCEMVAAEMRDLLEKLNVVATPREPPGRHVRYRCKEVKIPGNTKLAEEIHLDPETDKPKRRTIIETRGEGGYAVAPGSPADVHENNRPYVHCGGPVLSQVQTITADEREVLLRCAASFNRVGAEEEPSPKQKASLNGAVRVGDDYSARGPDWPQILEPHGWRCARQAGAKSYWRRPGKDAPGWSATTGVCANKEGHAYLSVFSSNADPFPGPSAGRTCSVHTKFAAYALLNHGGDFTAAAKQLASEGYGEQRAKNKGRGESTAKRTDRFSIGSLTLQPGQPRQTPSGKLSVPVNALRDGSIVFPFVLTTAASSRREPERVLRQLLGDDPAGDKIDEVLTALLADAAGRLANRQEPSGPTVYDILSCKVPEALQLACRTQRGIWSERRGGEISRADFVTFTTPELVDECGKGSNVPRDVTGQAVRSDLIRLIQLEMGVLWAHLVNTLPPAEHADLGRNTERGRAFRQAMIALWTRAQMFEVVKAHESVNGEIASRASLISRVRSQAREFLSDPPRCRPDSREKWRQIHHAFDGWWRPREDKEGQLHILLAMRYTLAQQTGVEIPGVADQDSLTRLGDRFGVFEEPPPKISAFFNRGKVRLAVLAQDLAEELLSEPMEDEVQKNPEPGKEG